MLYSILKAHNIPPRGAGGNRATTNAYIYDVNFFSRQNALSAYWAGFFMADGCLYHHNGNSYMIRVFLAEKDRSHIETFCDALGLGHEAIHSTQPKVGSKQYGITLNYTKFAEHLLPWGIIPNKTYHFAEPQVPLHLLPHYLRGWADGDGCVFISKKTSTFSVAGHPQAMEWYKTALKQLGYPGLISIYTRTDTHAVSLRIGGLRQMKQVAEILKVQDGICLKRKWHPFL